RMTGCHCNRERENRHKGGFFTQPDLQARDYQFPTNGHHISHPPARATAPFSPDQMGIAASGTDPAGLPRQ
ncbi:hypothetical protein ACUODG_006362, partial [Pseudomonas aeruginosa]